MSRRPPHLVRDVNLFLHAFRFFHSVGTNLASDNYIKTTAYGRLLS